jgi:sulfate transport system ATP-binding protein
MNAGRIEQIGTPEEVFHQPANEFVMNFLGHVNIFHGRVEGNRAFLGPLEVEYGGQHRSTAAPARGLVRPYDLDIALQANGKAGFQATISHINAAGPRVKIDLMAESGDAVHVEIPHERFRDLCLHAGQNVFVIPREINVYVDDGM